MKMLPHRYPFLMVDRWLKIEGNKIVGVKNVTMNEPYFQGHFPRTSHHAGRAATGGDGAGRRAFCMLKRIEAASSPISCPPRT
jgi:hypothetical protein